MAINEKLMHLIKKSGKRQYELADYYGITAQSMNNKFTRGSFSAEDLIKIAEFTGAELCLILGDDKITFGVSDIRGKSQEDV